MKLLLGLFAGVVVVGLFIMYERLRRDKVRRAILLELRRAYPESVTGIVLWTNVLGRVGEYATPAYCFVCAEELAAEGAIRSTRLSDDASPDLRLVRYQLAGAGVLTPERLAAPLSVEGV